MKQVAIILMFLSVCGKAMGFIRNILLAHFWGASYVIDAYLTAGSIGGILFGWLISVSSCYTPVYLEVKVRDSEKAAQQFTGKLLGMVTASGIAAMLFIIAFRAQVIDVIVPGYSAEAKELTEAYLLVSLSSLVIVPVTQICKYYFEANHYFITAAVSDLFVSLSQIGLIGLAGGFRRDWLGISLILPYCVQLIFMLSILAFLKRRIYPSLGITEDIKKIYLMLLPVFASSMLSEISGFIDKLFASHLEAGSVSMLNYACSFRDVLQNVFMGAVLAISYPAISLRVVKGDIKELNRYLDEWMENIAALFIPLTAGGGILAGQVMEILYKRGDFVQENVEITARIFVGYIIALLPLSLAAFLLRLCYAYQNTRISFYIGAVTVACNIIFNVLFIRKWQAAGLAFATSLSSWIAFILLLHIIRTLDKGIMVRPERKELCRICLSSFVMGAGVFISKRAAEIQQGRPVFAAFMAEVLVGIFLYVLLMWKLNSRVFWRAEKYLIPEKRY